MSLKISKLRISLVDTETSVVKGVSLDIEPGTVHVLMGQNGSGKSTLAKTLLGHPDYQLKSGKIEFEGADLTESSADERAAAGLFLANQYPTEVLGVNLGQFLRISLNNLRPEVYKKLSLFKFRQLVREKLALLDLPEEFLDRNLNEGFSGGEKKKCEILQLLLLKPKLAILDETDSGLDVDALKTVFKVLASELERRPELSLLVVTHYARVLDYLEPDYVHVMNAGKIVASGGRELVDQIEDTGYKSLLENKS